MSTSQAVELMLDFAERTGLTSERAADRYLWTDAFAVCNFLGLARQTGKARFGELAARLVDQVHHVLGRHRDDDSRQGWLSGLGEEEGEAHPTRGGLRIGKPRPERRPDEAFDQRLEWERDGQYFHYLTKWMHALDLMALADEEPTYGRWARELAQVAHEAFVYEPGGQQRPRMYWKMSIDLSRPLVPSMGHHDPLDGYVTVEQLRAAATRMERADEAPTLEEERASFGAMVAGRDWTTTDPLGLGGLLIDAARLCRLLRSDDLLRPKLLHSVVDAAARGLRQYAASGQLDQPAGRRLAFRELGLAIGLAGAKVVAGEDDAPAGIDAVLDYTPLGERIVEFWRTPARRQVRSWTEHANINDVMLATALAPEGLLGGRSAVNLATKPCSTSPRSHP